MPSPLHLGGCACGAVRYAADGPATNRCWCHCASCRRATGTPAAAWVTFAAGHFAWTTGAPVERASSVPVLRGRCGDCGTPLSYRHARRLDEIDILVATLDDPAPFAPESHIWVADKVPWLQLADGLPQYPGWRTT